jgi:hypothetical protein
VRACINKSAFLIVKTSNQGSESQISAPFQSTLVLLYNLVILGFGFFFSFSFLIAQAKLDQRSIK